ncbi:MAG: branched-chain alpha-keto acid dehydrogenase subunit E2 [Spirochaetes bacterium]|nr:MAG: branched-chain alpha-keto acid dehydrogenase subunit E2 [Spirochaetota bacterium]
MAIVEIKVPDLEGSTDVGVVEVYVHIGDTVENETPLISLESDKAVMDVPSPLSGIIKEIKVSEGDNVNAGDVIALAEVIEKVTEEIKDVIEEAKPQEEPAHQAPENETASEGKYHATPSVRSLARELGVDLGNVKATGPKGRITREDVSSLVKNIMSGSSTGSVPAGPFTLPPIPTADFEAFGDIETEDLSRIKRISGPHLHRNWLGVPHVTQFDEADITDLEAFRKEMNAENARENGPKISPLIFIIKAVVQALKTYPDFNSSLAVDGTSLIRKKYYNIGIAVDTPGGLVVPVIKDADNKGVLELAEVLADLSFRAREGKLKSNEMKGGTFSISSLGGIGGTYFTPIVNAPEVAILGLSRAAMKPVWDGSEFKPRLVLPFSLSYDHRVIDGASGARFTSYLSKLLGDMRRALL